eukprot:CAMPEP_0184659606 /NCGR_PEP_ID=MMETSP0308-20130426/30337_1 /TAXON_ID=38269 /ORGANISM="Gloeochaete witrockiana, Strain SAG 46.84" /LENGTH=303 /DNA_ID=CAMNT_0027099561 /DNA_START=3 /DNA_END=914 /DNA_ORIENTATION=+
MTNEGPARLNPSVIKNRIKRIDVFKKLKHDKSVAKREERKRKNHEAQVLGDNAPPKKVPKTLDNTRVPDETIVQTDDTEVAQDEATDEYADYFNGKTPKTLITTNLRPSPISYDFIRELLKIFPNSFYYKRGTYEIKNIVKYCSKRDFTDIIILNEDRKTINGLWVCHLPNGPTAHFKVSNVKLPKEIRNHGKTTLHRPELILNNFNTRLGRRVGRMFAGLFPHDPNFHGRRVVTFHNQRDFLFFRHHRYIFEGRERARLQELGPRFTLKLQSLQTGTFDTLYGEYEWVHKTELDTSRRQFFL